MTVRINMWSSPRNLSTAMMYAWRQRQDTTVFDEPLYAHYLRVSGREHPGRTDVLAAQNPQGREVVRDLLLGTHDTPVVFFKQMAKHLVELDREFMTQGHNVLLTREPHDMLTSLQRKVPDATLADTGFVELCEILDDLLAHGTTPVVVDTKRLLEDPRRVLHTLCERLDLPWEDAMLTWPSGPKLEDGVWAQHWYDGVHKSTGWKPWAPKNAALTPAVRPVLDQAMPLYERLLPHCI